MRLAIVAALLLACSCRHRGDSYDHVLATLPSSDTPVWMGVANSQLLVGVAHGEVGSPETALIAISLSSGQQHQLAGSLPAGVFDVQDGKLYLAAYVGEIGTVDFASGAYTKLVALDASASALAVTPQGYIVGTTGHLELYAKDGSHHASRARRPPARTSTRSSRRPRACSPRPGSVVS